MLDSGAIVTAFLPYNRARSRDVVCQIDSLAHAYDIFGVSNIDIQPIKETSMKFWLHHALWPLLLLAITMFFLEHQHLDIAISHYFFDAKTQHFPLQTDWFFKNVLHGYGNYPARIIFIGLFVGLFATLKIRFRQHRAMLVYLTSSLAASAAATVLIKMNSDRACPWDLQEFNGAYPTLGWFDSLPASLAPGHCWPSGFVIGAFCLFAFYFASLGRTKRSTQIGILVVILVYGNLLGFIQVMRGAHLFSHHIYTGIICWYVSLACFAIFQSIQKRKAQALKPTLI